MAFSKADTWAFGSWVRNAKRTTPTSGYWAATASKSRSHITTKAQSTGALRDLHITDRPTRQFIGVTGAG